MIKMITRESNAADAASNWLVHYRLPDGEWKAHSRGLAEEIYRDLVALGPHPQPDDVDKVIGNGSWTSTGVCGECGLDNKSPKIMFVSDSDYGTHMVCASCLREALRMLEEASK
jgi:hypothetical protein